MTTDAETVESICRELAARKVQDWDSTWDTFPLDPRFEALRGEHEFSFRGGFACRWCECIDTESNRRWEEVVAGPYCLRTDLGSIVRAAAACDNSFAVLACVAESVYRQPLEEWIPELAAARALKDAVNAST